MEIISFKAQSRLVQAARIILSAKDFADERTERSGRWPSAHVLGWKSGLPRYPSKILHEALYSGMRARTGADLIPLLLKLAALEADYASSMLCLVLCLAHG